MRIPSFGVGLPRGPLGAAAHGTIANCLTGIPLLHWDATRTGPIQLKGLCLAGDVLVISSTATATGWLLVRETMHANGWSGPLTVGGVSYATFVLPLAGRPQSWRTLRHVLKLRSALRRQAWAAVAPPLEAPKTTQ